MCCQATVRRLHLASEMIDAVSVQFETFFPPSVANIPNFSASTAINSLPLKKTTFASLLGASPPSPSLSLVVLIFFFLMIQMWSFDIQE